MNDEIPPAPSVVATRPHPGTEPAEQSRRNRYPLRWLMLLMTVTAATVMLAPFLLLVLNAFKTSADYSRHGPLSWPGTFTPQAFSRYLSLVDFPVALGNSVFIAGAVAFLGAALALISAYAIGIGRVRCNGAILAVLLLATMVPQEALIYPLFYGAEEVGLLNSVWSVVIVFTVLQAAFGTYLLASVMTTLPKELLEAAVIDGASRWQILWRVVFPVLRPTLSVLVVFFFIWTWNEFYLPLILLNDPSAQTVPIALATLRGQHSIDITVLNAGSLLSLLPTLVFFLVFQRTLSRGVTAGAVK
ncbi:carbohydrate ABC transporter permease [Streptomyces malaysiensis subsp. malaysiensis]|uniref:Carbohydrate ABC transporter permease n=1 Tax=Streptomyces malaysiensis TaxID=92644 RepID=A0ABX6WHK2_STRMQ|nr:Lactose transport system permease protein LacG [Streptomyces sp. M56]MYX59564.1 ABC transporter permease subunit [Streptomyces sp. SID8382]QPI60903.1 carbohydrate ABC transporter permease [Streptomyces solisilvae]